LAFGSGRVVFGAQGTADAGLGTKTVLSRYEANSEQVCGRRGNDCRGLAIRRSSEGHEPVQPSQAGNPLPLVVSLAKALHVGKSAIDGPDHKRYRFPSAEKGKRTVNHRRHWQDSQHDIELASFNLPRNLRKQAIQQQEKRDNRKQSAPGW